VLFVPLRLSHVDLVLALDFPIEISVGDVDGFDVFTVESRFDENDAEGSEASGRGEGLVVVDTRHLCESLSYQTRLILVDGSVRVTFDDEYPPGTDDLATFGELDEFPSAVDSVGVHLAVHGCLPMFCLWRSEGLADVVGCVLWSCRSSIGLVDCHLETDLANDIHGEDFAVVDVVEVE
jgi:hypothetical protein